MLCLYFKRVALYSYCHLIITAFKIITICPTHPTCFICPAVEPLIKSLMFFCVCCHFHLCQFSPQLSLAMLAESVNQNESKDFFVLEKTCVRRRKRKEKWKYKITTLLVCRSLLSSALLSVLWSYPALMQTKWRTERWKAQLMRGREKGEKG